MIHVTTKVYDSMKLLYSIITKLQMVQFKEMYIKRIYFNYQFLYEEHQNYTEILLDLI